MCEVSCWACADVGLEAVQKVLRRQSNVRRKTNAELVRCGRHNSVEPTLRRKKATRGEGYFGRSGEGRFMAGQGSSVLVSRSPTPVIAYSGDSKRFAFPKEVGYFAMMVIDSIAKIMGGNILKLTGWLYLTSTTNTTYLQHNVLERVQLP